MVNLIRKYQQPLLVIVTCLVIVIFIFFWNGSQGGRAGLGGSPKRASIYGQAVTDADIQRELHKYELAEALGLNDMLQSLSGNAESREQEFENYLWNSYVFDHEADALQVFPTDKEVQDALLAVPGLQTDGHFDQAKLQDVVANRLPSLGFSDTVIDDLVREQVRIQKVRELIGSAVTIGHAELVNRFQVDNEKLQIAVVRLSLSDVEKTINVTDADAKKAYDAHPDTYQQPEQRQVVIASFELSDSARKLSGKDRTEALEKTGSDAWTFAQAVVDKSSDFSDIAKKSGAFVEASGTFSQAQPDPAFSNIPSLADSTFKLSQDYPNSDVLEGENGYYVIHLQQIVPSRPLSFQEAKPAIIAQLRKEGAGQMMQTKANELRNQLIGALKSGKSFTDAAAAYGLKADDVPAFSLQDASRLDIPDVQQVVENAISLSAGQISDFVSTDAGGLFVFMKARQPVSQITALIGEAVAKNQMARQKEYEAFAEWLRLRKDAARLQIVQS